MRVLVCGGAGYIGSHMAKYLAEQGHSVTVLDDLSTGHRESVRWGKIVVGSVLDRAFLDSVFSSDHYDAVMHFCARSLVYESMLDPLLYYRTNVAGTLTLLEAMRSFGVDRLVFSSTAAIFGSPVTDIIDESHVRAPINPYGMSKLICEHMIEDAVRSFGLRAVALRYFNAAGASLDGKIGESHCPETHLIPNVLKSLIGRAPKLKVFGDDYPTRDGSCVRDYVHVEDLASAHLAAISLMSQTEGFHKFNLGNGAGFSVFEVISAAERVCGQPVPFDLVARRAGDPPSLVASSVSARNVLGWQPKHSDLEEIIGSAWRWHCSPAY